MPTAAAETRFDIFEFVVSGDTLLGTAAIERAVYPFLGPARSVGDAEGARKALERAYQDAGYLSVSVVLPPQRVDNAGGEVRLDVVAAAVDKLRVTGAQHHLPSRIEDGLPSVAPGQVPNFNDMQQELSQLARASADRELTPILSAGTRPGTLNVEMKVQDSLPLHASLELNNKQSVDTVSGRVEASISYDNLFQRGHSAGLSWFVAPRRSADANIVSVSYGLPLVDLGGGSGDRLSFLFTHSDSNTPTPIGGATTSRGDTARLRWRHELPAPPGINHALAWGLTARDLRDRNTTAGGEQTLSPPLRYTTLSAAYEFNLEHGSSAGAAAGSTNLFAELTASLPGINHRTVDCFGSPREQFSCKRSGTGPRFQVFNLSAQHRQAFAGWSLLARLQAQYSDTPLVSSEQVVYGGQDSVRGYLEGEQAGDLGAALRLELGTPGWMPWDGAAITGLLFHDAAVLRRLYASAEEVASPRLRSAGVGLRASTAFGLQWRVIWTRVLVPSSRLAGGVQRPISGTDAGHAERWELSVRQSF